MASLLGQIRRPLPSRRLDGFPVAWAALALVGPPTVASADDVLRAPAPNDQPSPPEEDPEDVAADALPGCSRPSPFRPASRPRHRLAHRQSHRALSVITRSAPEARPSPLDPFANGI